MTTPKSFKETKPLDARLVTKTSLPKPKRAIALVIALWFACGKPDTVEYGLDQSVNKNEDILDDPTVDIVKQYADENGFTVDYASLKNELKKNPLVTSQMESLNSAFELVWHLASFEFVDSSRGRTAERDGGIRYRKRIRYSTNLDIIDALGESNSAALAGVLLNWILDNETSDVEMERRLTRVLAVFTEPSLFKTSKGNSGKVFTQSGIYDALLDDSDDAVDIVDPGEEPQGTTRILKPAIVAGLNPMLATEDSKVVKADGIDEETLRSYSNRAKKSIELSNVKAKLADNASDKRTELPEAIDEPRNLIFFGAPGTGKSYELNKLAIGESGTDNSGLFAEDNVRRVTFYPDYTYSQFVGCFKPCTRYAEPDGDEPASTEKPYVSYEFVPGPFLDTYIKAVQNPGTNYLLVVEEINRANPAAVFGDIFQLLDRGADGRSEYQVSVPREMETHFRLRLPEYATTAYFSDAEELLQEQLRLKSEEKRLSIPPNMFIWATMNSADQGVFPMDTAFKRRWDFRYIGINHGEAVIDDKEVEIAGKGHPRTIKWNDLRHSINELLLDHAGVNEDKLLGPFFIRPDVLKGSDSFAAAFKDKVLLYLFEDAGKTKRKRLFADGNKTYSQVCETFEKHGTDVFAEGFKEIPDQGVSENQEDEISSADDAEV